MDGKWSWWERFWYAITHPGEPTPNLWDDAGWEVYETLGQENVNKNTDFGSGASSASSGGTSPGSIINDWTGVSATNAFNAAEAEKNRDWSTEERIAAQAFNSAEAQKSRDWSQMMESTRYQRTMQDMEAAGVNPMAAFMSGSASLAGAGSTANAATSAASSSPASGAGNSATAVSGIIKALTSLLRVAK